MLFNAVLIEKDSDKRFFVQVTQISKTQLGECEGNTLVKVDYSSLNYKDALAVTNSGPVVRTWPMVPGIDGVGTVIKCGTDQYKLGDIVILNGWGCGEVHWGCMAEYVYVKADWLIPLPSGLTAWQAMAIGTAGYTAALCVQKIVQHGTKPEQGKILVTGATGGVGSVAIALLVRLGYQVVASTAKASDQNEYLLKLGVNKLIDRASLSVVGKPLQKERWAAAIDVVGSHTLANVCAQTQYGGIVAACGLAQGMDFPSTVAPFILRGVTLAGVDSVMASYRTRIDAWDYLAQYLDVKMLTDIAQTISLSAVLEVASEMMQGRIKGRFVVDVNT